MKKAIIFLILIVMSTISLQLFANENSWARYYDRYRNDLSEFMNLSNDRMQHLRPGFHDGIFVLLRDYNPTSYDVRTHTSYSTRYLPNWHDLIWTAPTWMDAVHEMEDYGWEQWWEGYYRS